MKTDNRNESIDHWVIHFQATRSRILKIKMKKKERKKEEKGEYHQSSEDLHR